MTQGNDTQKWEYQVVAHHLALGDVDKQLRRLNFAGEQGWELIHVRETQLYPQEIVFYYKRPKGAE